MKKKLFAAGIIAICLSLCVGSTWAYFTSSDTAHNVITSGKVGIEIIEKTKSGDGVELDFPADGLHNIMPGSSVSKIVSVSNSGEAEAWIRVKVDAAIVGADGDSLPLQMDVHGVKVPVMTFAVEQGWIDGGDGYYYYSSPVTPGEKTSVFFDKVTFALEMGNAYQRSTANLTIVAQAVQTANNPIPDGGDVTDIPGWPET